MPRHVPFMLQHAMAEKKQVRNTFKSKNLVSTSRPLELLHIDLFGLMDVLSMGGKSYGFVIEIGRASCRERVCT